MDQHKRVLNTFLKNLRQEAVYKDIRVTYLTIGTLNTISGKITALNVSGVRLEGSHEGLYYDHSDDSFFYYGEVPGICFGGQMLEIPLESELLSMVNDRLKAALKEVSKTRRMAQFTFHPRNGKTGHFDQKG